MGSNNVKTQTAVFIDGSWLYGVSRRINKKIDYAIFFNNLVSNFGPKTKIYFYGAINPDNKQQIRFYNFLKKIGYVVHLVELTKIQNVFVPKGLDIELAVNAMQILPSIKRFVLVSGDSDFVSLLKQVINCGVSVSVIALPFTTGYLLKKIVGGSFLNLETLINEQKSVKKFSIFKKEKKTKISSKKIVQILPMIRKKKKTKVLAPNSLYIKKGDHFNSYIHIRNLMMSAKNNITIIDEYVDDGILAIIKLLKTKINIIIFTYKYSPADFCLQVKKLRGEERSIVIYKTSRFHDRFLGIDNVWWHSGHSFKDLGRKDSMLNKVIEKVSLDKLKTSVAEEGQNSGEICK